MAGKSQFIAGRLYIAPSLDGVTLYAETTALPSEYKARQGRGSAAFVSYAEESL